MRVSALERACFGDLEQPAICSPVASTEGMIRAGRLAKQWTWLIRFVWKFGA